MDVTVSAWVEVNSLCSCYCTSNEQVSSHNLGLDHPPSLISADTSDCSTTTHAFRRERLRVSVIEYLDPYVCACVCVLTYMCMCVCVFVCSTMCRHVCMHACVHARACECGCVCAGEPSMCAWGGEGGPAISTSTTFTSPVSHLPDYRVHVMVNISFCVSIMCLCLDSRTLLT